MKFAFSLAAAFSLSSLSAFAHHIWIEQDATSAKLYFGEFGENLREASPGALDKIAVPAATLVSATGEKVLEAKKTAVAYDLQAKAAAGESVVAQVTGRVREKKEGDKVTRGASNPAARWIADFSAQPAKLTLDIVPTGKTAEGEVEFVVSFQGKPLAKTKVALTAASGWGRELTTDSEGKITAAFPWQGAYELNVRATDTTPGERDGEKYDSASYVTTLVFTLDKGLTPPQVPAAKAH